MPLQVILLAMLTMAASESAQWIPPVSGVQHILATLIGSYVIVVAVVAFASSRAIVRLHNSARSSTDITHNTHRLIEYARWACLALLAVHLAYSGWGDLVLRQWGLKRYPMAAEFLMIAPVLLAFLSFWACTYYIDRAARERSLAYVLLAGGPAHPMPGLFSYLVMQARHNFYLLAIIAFKAVINWAAMDTKWSRAYPRVALLTMGLVLVGLFVMTPWIIVHMWKTTPLPDPPAGRLFAVAREYRIRFTSILLWHTHNMMPNAAILGPVPVVRYFLMTDALMESLTDRQIEAVFAHEIGHGYHRHMWWYTAFIVGVAAGTSALADLVGLAIPSLATGAANEILSFVFLGICMGLGFSYISHRFEHQADWFAAKHMAKSLARQPEVLSPVTLADYAAPADGPAGATPPPPADAPPLQTPSAEQQIPSAQGATSDRQLGAEMFASALKQLVEMSHRSLNKRGWAHPSVVQREHLVHQLAASPHAAAKFERKMIWLRCAIATFIALCFALMALNSTLTHEP
jgi:Zn-dependent protease with chaperone function